MMASPELQYQSGSAQSQVSLDNHSNQIGHPFISAYNFINSFVGMLIITLEIKPVELILNWPFLNYIF